MACTLQVLQADKEAHLTIRLLDFLQAIQSTGRSDIFIPSKQLTVTSVGHDILLDHNVQKHIQSYSTAACVHQGQIILDSESEMLSKNGVFLSKKCTWLFMDSIGSRRQLENLSLDFNSLVFLLQHSPSANSLAVIEYYPIGQSNIFRQAEYWKYAKNHSSSSSALLQSWGKVGRGGEGMQDYPWHLGKLNRPKATELQNPQLIEKAQPIWQRRSNLKGLHFKVGFVPYGSHFYKDTNGKPTGFFPSLMAMLAGQMNFTFTDYAESSYGSQDENGTWSGVVGAAVQGNIDIIGNALKMNVQREKVISFGTPFLYTQERLAYFAHETSGTSIAAMFHAHFLVLFSAAFLLLVIAAVLITCSLATSNNDFTSLCIAVYGTFVAQGSSELQSHGSAKILFLTCLVLGYIVLSSFSALLTSHLSVEIVTDMIKDPVQLMELDYDVYAHFGGSAMDFFRLAMNNTPQKQIWETKMKEQSHYLPLTEDLLHERYQS